MIDVKFGIASNGNGGLIEQPKFAGNDIIQFRYLNEWQDCGNRARSYGCSVKPNQLLIS